jgi:hypothetical protein
MQQAGAAQDNPPPRHGKALVVCVDDFGLSAAVDGSVFALAAQGRISATACLVDAPAFRADAPRLREAFGARLDLGLHLNLSESFPGAPAPGGWGALVLRACARQLDRRALQHEIGRQLEVFERTIGRAPDFVDGHRHVHQLPVVREALLAALAERGLRPWLRCTLGRAPGFKQGVIGMLGARALRRLARWQGLGQNRRMLGVYGFDAGTPEAYEALLAGWLAMAQDGDLLMCHTALPGTPDGTDPIAAARCIEHAVLAGECGARCFLQAGVQPARWRDTACGIAAGGDAMPPL